MPTIHVTDLSGTKSSVTVKSGDTLMEVLRDNGYSDIVAMCGGVCSCSTCHVYIDKPWADKLDVRREDEFQLVSSTACYKESSRLSCQVSVTDELDGMEVVIANQDY